MIPVLTPEEMAAVDSQAPEPTEVLVGRAGAAVARRALRVMGGAFGRRVVVIAGPGNNGADGRHAASVLSGWGADVTVVAASEMPPGSPLPAADLVIDAAFGTGLRRPYAAPRTQAPVLAVDIPSGVDGSTGRVLEGGSPLGALCTVTFASLKPGLLFSDGPGLAGDVEVVDIGLRELVERAASCWVVEDADVARMVPPRAHDSHKYQSAVQVVAGSPGMTGAPWLVSRSAMRAGAGYVRLSMPGVDTDVMPPGELVHLSVPAHGWHKTVLDGLSKVKALVVGPGLGRVAHPAPQAGPAGDLPAGDLPGGEVGQLLAGAPVPAVLDADGLNAMGDIEGLATVVARRQAPTIITPHDGELARLQGGPPGADRIATARSVARRTGAIVLLKGSTTVVAAPDGRALVAMSGSSRLATAGTGDVLSGLIGAFVARGTPALEAAALGAHVHGRAASLGFSTGLVASDLPDLVATWLSALAGAQ